MATDQGIQPPPPPLPPWVPPSPPSPPKGLVAVFVCATLAILGGVAAWGSNDTDKDTDKDTDNARSYTLTEAACKQLRDGDDPDFVYGVMKRLAADHPLTYGEDESVAARSAVRQAQAQGCGR